MTNPNDRYDSLFQVYAEWDRAFGPKGTWVRRPVILDWKFLRTQTQTESGLDPDAVSPVGAHGLSQFMSATFNEWVVNQFGSTPPPNRHISPYDPEDAIWAQADMMAWLISYWKGDVRQALASYNWGIGRVRKVVLSHGNAWETQLPTETREYLRKILG